MDLFNNTGVREADLKALIVDKIEYCYNRFEDVLKKSKSASPLNFLKLMEILLKIYDSLDIIDNKKFEQINFSNLKSQMIDNLKALEEFENDK